LKDYSLNDVGVTTELCMLPVEFFNSRMGKPYLGIIGVSVFYSHQLLQHQASQAFAS